MSLQAGDIGFSRDPDIAGWWIRFAESRKYGRDLGPRSPAHWNHVFMLTGPGTLIEAVPAGIVMNQVSGYARHDLAYFRPTYPEPDGAAVAVAAMTALLGEKYDDLNLISDALYLVFHLSLRFGVAGRNTCSGSTAHSLELAGIDMGPYEDCSTPADVFAVGLRDRWTGVEP